MVYSIRTDQNKSNDFFLKDNPRFTKTLSDLKSYKEIDSIYSGTATAMILAKKTLIKSATVIKKTPLNIFSFLAGTSVDLTKTICRYLTKHNHSEWK